MTNLFLKAYGFLSGGWIGYAVVASFLISVGATSGNYARGLFDRPTISDLTAQVAVAKKQTSDETARYNKLWAQTQSAMQIVEASRADQNAKAADQARKDGATIASLQATLTKTETERATTSARLTAELNNAKSSDDRPLGPASVHYFDGLRERQAGNANGDGQRPNPPGAGGTNP